MTNMGEKNTVLVVDDAPANLQVVHSILKDSYTIRVATSGAKALDLVKIHPLPVLVLLDVMMPEMDGYEVCVILKATPKIRDIPVIFLTGKTEADDETKGFELGAADYIHKPFSPTVVKARVHNQLVLREAREQLARQLLSIHREMEMARQIQLSILPREIPNIKGLDIAARYVPMGSVAGDFYDFIVVDEQHVGALIADVTGHGLPAALIASMLQVALSAQFAHAYEPGRVLAGLNRALCGKFAQHFVTAAYLFVDMEKNTLSYAAAGHPPLLLWHASTGSASEVCENGMLLGHFSEATYPVVQMPVESGDRAILYTDGVLETKNPAEEEFGLDHFKRFLESNPGLRADLFADSLLDELYRWSGHSKGEEQQDDITLLVIHFKSDE